MKVGVRVTVRVRVRVRVRVSVGVPSTRSTPERCSVSPLTLSSRTRERPRLLGRCGVRVAKRPVLPPSRRGGFT